MGGLRDFVPGGFPLPWVPVYDGMGEFVGGGFPLPQNPVASVNGSLPKAPPIHKAQIAPLPDSSSGVGCCCAGMGRLGDTIIPQASLPEFLQGDFTIPVVNYTAPLVYVAAGAIVVAMVMFGGGRSRRR
jgi:hypothetical protein